jgi:hypothetical protein
MRRCPHCAEQIQNEAIICRWCNRSTVPWQPLPPAGAGYRIPVATPIGITLEILGGTLVGLSPVMPWVSILVIGNVNLFQVADLGQQPAAPWLLTVLGAGAIAIGALGRHQTSARVAQAVLALLCSGFGVLLLVDLRNAISQTYGIVSLSVGIWLELIGAAVLLASVAVSSSTPPVTPVTMPSGPPQPVRPRTALVVGAAAVIAVALLIVALALQPTNNRPTTFALPSTEATTVVPGPAAPEPIAPATPSAPIVPAFPAAPTTSSTTTAREHAPTAALAAAEDLVRSKGYTPDPNTSWDLPHQLSVILATATGSADGYNQTAFFFYNGTYLGTDAIAPSAGISEAWQDDATVALSYQLYNAADPDCCPTAGSAIVRFHWTGTQLIPLDPIPPNDSATGGSRR